jgi:hypothetical protein
MRRLLVDTDTAADDPVALVMALRHPGVRVEAITVVAGNVPVDHGVQNALYTLGLLGKRVPVFRGAGAPLLAPLETSQFIHGEDGMGDVGLPLRGRKPHPEHAVDALLETAGRYPGEFELVTLGPLTNVAMGAPSARHSSTATLSSSSQVDASVPLGILRSRCGERKMDVGPGQPPPSLHPAALRLLASVGPAGRWLLRLVSPLCFRRMTARR